MEELFANIPERVRKQTKFWVEFALTHHNILEAIKMIESYRATCSDEEKEYLDFVVLSYGEQYRESSSN